MPHFINRKRNYTLSANHKVMSSTLDRQVELQLLSPNRFSQLQFRARYFPFFRMAAYLIVRNPFERLASFFRDKLRQHPKQFSSDDDFFWQDCQRLLFPFLGISPNASCEEIQTRLLQTSFSEFLEILPSVYLFDPHLIPQHTIAFCEYRYWSGTFEARFDRVYQMDHEEERLSLTELGIDLMVKTNTTDSEADQIEWTPELRSVVTTLYRDDFLSYGYRMKE